MKNKNILGHLQIIMSSSLFGLMPLFTKMAYSYGATPITVAFCRCFYAAIILAVMLPFMKKNIFAIERKQIVPMLKIAIPFGLIPVSVIYCLYILRFRYGNDFILYTSYICHGVIHLDVSYISF